MRKSQKHQKSQLKYDLIGLSVLIFGIIVLVSLIARESGVIISPIIEGFRLCVGLGVYFVPAGLILAGLFIIIKLEKVKPSNLLIGLGLFFSSFIGLIQALSTHGKTWPEITENTTNSGGFLGAGLIFLLRNGFGNTASYVILGALLLVGVLIMVDVPLVHISAVLLGKLGRLLAELRGRAGYIRRKREVIPFEPIRAPLRTVKTAETQEKIFAASVETPKEEGKETLQEVGKSTEGYQMPPISILEGEEVEVQKGKPEAQII